MQKDTQSRRWQLTINNPVDKGLTHDVIKDILAKFKSCIYWCMSDEVGESQTYHTHIYMYCSSCVRFSTVKKRFDSAHIEFANGTAQQNRDYVFKEGKWRGSEKEVTNLVDTHEEYGELPIERQGARNDITDLYDMIKSGMSNAEILEDSPQYLLQIDKLDKVRQTIVNSQMCDKWRDLDVTYIWGLPGAGKTRYVMEKYGYPNVYRVTDYKNPFDGYNGQDVILFEEFCSGNGYITMDSMKKYLDGYPVELPARYSNHQACYTKVYFCTNVDLRCQYPNVHVDNPMSWAAFVRRIHRVVVYLDKGQVVTMDTEKYLKEYFPYFGQTPFDV